MSALEIADPIRASRLGRALCIGGAALGALGLLGWIAGRESLTVLLPGQQPSMKPNTALALLLIGGAGALRHPAGAAGWRNALSTLAALAVLAIGAATLAEYVLGLDLHVDRLFVQDQAGPYPGRPSPPTALALTLLAAAVLLSGARTTARARLLEGFALAAGLTAFTSLTGIAFGAGPLYRLTHAPLTGVALPTAIGLLLTSAGLLLESPAQGITRAFTSPGPGGVLLRRLAIPAIAAPMLLGFILIRSAAVLGLEPLSLLTAIVTSGLTVVSLVLLTVTAVHLDRTHEALESSRRRLRMLVEQAPDGIFVADLTGRYTDVNLAGCRILGYTREEIVGKTIADLISPEDVERLAQSKDRMLGGAVEVGEWRLRRADGSYLSVEVSASILPDGRWQGFVRDIGERKRAEDKLREARERIHLALRGADLATWDWNVQSGEVIFNPRWAEMRGFRPEEIRPHVDSWASGIHPEDRPRVQRALDDHFQGRVPEYESEFRARTRSGQWIWVLDRGKVFARDERGRPLRMVGTELDVTARKRAEDEVRLAEAKSSGIVSISADAIVCIDEDQRITLFNDGAEEIFGYSKAEVIGSPLDVLLPARFATVHRRHVEEFAAGKQVARRTGERGLEIVGRRKNGEEFPADAAISKLEVAGKRILTVALHDVTEQRRLHEELRRAIRSRDELLGIVAHDLRNPLSSIVMQASRLRRRGPEPERRSLRPLEAIERAASRMRRLIQDLLDVTMLEAGRLSIERGRLAVEQLVSDVVEAQRALASAAALELRLDLAQDVPDVLADRDRLLQVFENLVGNALRLTGPGGRITIGAAPRGAEVLFRIADTGPGIPPEDAPHLFDRFWRGRKAGNRGAGLGLPIVKGIVEAHGGHVWFESAPGRGATFFFTIPAAPWIGAPPPEPAPPSTPG